MSRRALLAALAACAAPPGPGDGAAPWVVAPAEDSGRPPRAWRITPLLDGPGGLHLRLALASDGTPWAAWWSGVGVPDGVCDEVGAAPPPRLRQDLVIASPAGAVVVDRPVVALSPPGLALALRDDEPALAWTGGAPTGQLCGGHDAVIASAPTWSPEVAAASSSDAVTGQPASDAGFVVGLWPALAFDGRTAVLAYQDAHFGALQRDDAHRADAELAIGGDGAWSHAAVDVGEGGGHRGAIVLDGDGRPVLAHVVPVSAQGGSRRGLGVARGEGGAWPRVQLYAGEVPHTVALSRHGDTLAVAWYAPDDARAWLATLSDPDALTDPDAWARTPLGDPRYDSGHQVALAHAPDGELLAAWRRCARVGAGACVASDEAVVVARASTGFAPEPLPLDHDGHCGQQLALAVAADGAVHVAFQCDVSTADGAQARPFLAVEDR